MNLALVTAHPLPGQPGALRAAAALSVVTMCDSASAGIADMSRPDPRWGA
jgi:hypothetical protein